MTSKGDYGNNINKKGLGMKHTAHCKVQCRSTKEPAYCSYTNYLPQSDCHTFHSKALTTGLFIHSHRTSKCCVDWYRGTNVSEEHATIFILMVVQEE
jgi:hypothetical protein